MSLSAMAAALEAENARLQAEVTMLRRLLSMTDESPPEVELMIRHKMTRGEASLLLELISARGRPVDRYRLESAIPERNPGAGREAQIVDVLLSKLRKKLGPGVIETVRPFGWRVASSWAAQLHQAA